MTNLELLEEAHKARKNAYVPYSHHPVGAALLTKDGKLYHGCNVENAAFGPTNCAERTAVFTAVCAGDCSFERIAIVGGLEGSDALSPCAPCGVCRQVLMEFCDPETFIIVLPDGPGKYLEFTLKELLPMGFGPSNLKSE